MIGGESEHDRRMIAIGLLFIRMLRDCFKPRQQLQAEILVLRHQLNVLRQRAPRRRKIVFFGRFVAVLRTYSALLAGVNRMNWRYFLVMNALGGICWASAFGIGSYLFGEQATRVAGPVSYLLWNREF